MGKKWTIIIISVVAIAMSAFHLYTSGFGRFPALQQRSIHMAFGLVLTFLIYPFWKKKKRRGRPSPSAFFRALGSSSVFKTKRVI